MPTKGTTRTNTERGDNMSGLQFDLFGGNSPGLDFGDRPIPRAPIHNPRTAYRSPLPDEQYQNIGQQALHAGASGLGYVFGTLDKPGQVVRNTLAGKFGSALRQAVPFADTLGLVDQGDYTSGRDLTNQLGITGKHDKGWGAWGAGLGADILTDPLTYLTFGAKSALTPIGRAVQKTGALRGWSGKAMLEGFHGVEPALQAAGRTASDIAHMTDQGQRIAQGAAAATGVQANQPLGSLARIGLPFGGPSVNVGTGRTAQAIAGGLDAAGDWLKYGNPVGRAAGSLFDPNVHGAVDEVTQRGATRYLQPALQDLKAQARADRFDVIHGLDPLVSAGAHPESLITDTARAVAEGVPHPFPQALANDVGGVAQAINHIGSRQLAQARESGAPLRDVADPFVNYVPRSAFNEVPGSLQMDRRRLLPTTSAANIGRDPLYQEIPGGTNRIKDWFSRFAGLKAVPQVTQEIRRDLEQDLVRGGGTMTKDLADAFDVKAAALAEKLAGTNEAYRSAASGGGGKHFFSPDLVSDVTQRGNAHAKTVANARAATGILGDVAQPFQQGTGMIPLADTLPRLGIETTAHNPQTGALAEGGLVNLYRALAKQGAGKVDPFLTDAAGLKKLTNAVNQWGVTPEKFGTLTKQYGQWTAPEQIKTSLGAFDSLTNAFKSLAYPIWIPSHIRNAMTAAVNNARHGVGLGDYAKQLAVMTGRGISPAEAHDLRRAQYAGANVFGGNGMNEEIAGNVRQAFDQNKRFTPHAPGSDRAGEHGNLAADTADLVLKQGLLGSLGATGRAAREGLGGLLDKSRGWGQAAGENLGIKGVGQAAEDMLPAVAAGRKAGANIEDFFRGALFNKLTREGATPAMAADEINKLHFDYGHLTDFEKNVMRRAVPFYTFARNNLPLQVETALHQPGILQAQSKPFMQEDADEKGYVPKYLQGGFATPVGPEFQNAEGDASQQYISQFGLPAEEAFGKLRFQNGMPDLRNTALAFAGNLNPMIKAPLEQLFNTQFYSGRKLSDLKPQGTASAIGKLFGEDNPQLLAQVLANTPATRFISSADKLLDPRKTPVQKALNLLTGVKVTDVDTDKQRAIDLRQALQTLMEQYPHLSQHTEFYVKPDNVQNLTPEEMKAMRAYATQEAESRAWSKEQRRQIGVQR
ncbi:MAG: hypothetical protein P4L84_17990 [Isosphaeraceae bacterium]|nr:hypothetical protein [Isosphaeraceae bacterium]